MTYTGCCYTVLLSEPRERKEQHDSSDQSKFLYKGGQLTPDTAAANQRRAYRITNGAPSLILGILLELLGICLLSSFRRFQLEFLRPKCRSTADKRDLAVPEFWF